MRGLLIERRLRAVNRRLQRLREDLEVSEQQAAHFADEAAELQTRTIVSDSPMDEAEHLGAARQAAAMSSHHRDVVEGIRALEARQDVLLDKLTALRGS